MLTIVLADSMGLLFSFSLYSCFFSITFIFLNLFISSRTYFLRAKQCTYFLVHKKSIVKDACIYEEAQQWLFKPWSFDIKGDLVLASYSYTRTPIVLKTSVVVKGEKKYVLFEKFYSLFVFFSYFRDLFAINIHTKSKHVVKGKEKWESNEEEHRIGTLFSFLSFLLGSKDCYHPTTFFYFINVCRIY